MMKAAISTEKPATLGPTEKKAAIGVGAPWYTSGVHMWKGAAETLKARPIATRNAAKTSPPRAALAARPTPASGLAHGLDSWCPRTSP